MKRHIIWLIALLLIAAGGAQRLDRWRVIGPGGGGSQYNPTISPHDQRTVLASCDMTGAYITQDAGESWRMFNLGQTIRFFVFDPVDRNTIYAKTSVLWRSTDGGKTWGLVYPQPDSVTGAAMPDDHAGQRVLTKQPFGNVMALAIDPADSAVLYAAIRENAVTRLQISRDRGATWKESGELPAEVQRMYASNGGVVYVAAKGAMAVYEAGTINAGRLPEGVKAFKDISLGFRDGGSSAIIYGMTRDGVYVSEDRGKSWTQSPFPGVRRDLEAVAASLHHPEVAYVSYALMQGDGKPSVGVAKTADRGKTWQLLWNDTNMQNDWITERFGPDWGGRPYMLAAGPDDPNICYATDSGRVMRTLDGGKIWKGMYARKDDGGWTTNGMDVTTCYGVHFDPFDAKRLFISYTDIGLFRSDNGGRSWNSATMGVPQHWVNTTYWVEFDPKVKGRMWGAMSYTHDLPRPKMWRDQRPSGYRGGVSITDDGGESWRPSVEGMPETAATHILLDPESPVENRVLYVAGFGRGVFKSTDGGKHWTLKNTGIEGKEPFAWRFTRDSKGVLYLVVARRSEDGSIGNDQDGAIYRSTDGAEHWTKLSLPEGVNGPNGLAVDPKDPKRMYLAVWGRRTPTGATAGGIFLSTDAGKTWSNVLDKDQHVYDVTIDPKNPEILYACGFESSAWRSKDRGATWRRIPGYNFKWGHRVIPDPHHDGMIYIATYGGSVWYGPAEGDPKALEDITTPVLKYNR